MKFSVRKATMKDLKSLQDLNHELFLFEHKIDHSLIPNWAYSLIGKSFLKRFIISKTRSVFIAESNNIPIGFITGRQIAAPRYRKHKKIFQLSTLVVSEECRTKGVGQSLYSAFLKWAKSEGAEMVKVQALAENKNAVNFYKKVGFKPYITILEQEV